MWNEKEKKPIGEFIFWTFLISWSIEGIIIILEQGKVLPPSMQKAIVMILIGLGAGIAPAYATYIILFRNKKIRNLKDFWKRITACSDYKTTMLTLLTIMAYQLLKCIITEQLLDLPIICFLLFIPLMIFGGGLEEIGWRGFLQPALEERMPFVAATVVQGIIWALWHLPLWLIINANQSRFNFFAFLLYCVSFSFSLALLYKVCKCVWAVIVLHAWGNVVLGGMFSYKSLETIPTVKTIVLYLIEIVSVIIIVTWMRKKKVLKEKSEEKSIVISTLNIERNSEINSMFPNLQIINTNELKIGHCIGCNSCWVKTPGKCAVKDDYEQLFEKILLADRVIFITQERFGMVSYKLKNIVDRMIAVDLPYTCIKNGQTRHAGRYHKEWKIMLIVEDSTKCEYLNEWIERVAINFHSKSMGTYQLQDREGIKHALYNL